jgi:FKBP-type peptidyl-prolyl cis-trans isomerase
MRQLIYNKTLLTLVASVLLIVGCKEKTENLSEWVMGNTRVKIHKHGKGRKPTMNDVLLLKYWFFGPAGDTVANTYWAWDSVIDHHFAMPPYKGAIEQVLMELKEGDSASVWLAADSLKKYQGAYPNQKDRPDSLYKGKYYHYAIKVAAVKTEVERQTEILKKIEAEKIKQDSLIRNNSFFRTTWERDPKLVKDPSGMYYIIDEPGTGDLAAPGDSVIIGYAGSFLSGDFFDVSEEPQGFIYGKKRLIPGWEIAFSKFLRKGTQARLMLPSHLGFGHKGNQGIPPFVVLQFRIQVVDIIKAKDLPKYRKQGKKSS